jgi:PQQ-dependent catabolism-associated CXXCW motif protein
MTGCAGLAQSALVFACGVLLAAPALAGSSAGEPDGYRLGDYQSGTPLTVQGRAALDTTAARKLWETHAAAFIDVLSVPRRPDNLAPRAIWAPVPRRDIPGSEWLPEVGRGALTEPLETRFRLSLERISAGDRAASLVFYCRADCWMSWNATKRALSWGYIGAQWYRDGSDGWEAAGLPLTEMKPPEEMPR